MFLLCTIFVTLSKLNQVHFAHAIRNMPLAQPAQCDAMTTPTTYIHTRTQTQRPTRTTKHTHRMFNGHSEKVRTRAEFVQMNKTPPGPEGERRHTHTLGKYVLRAYKRPHTQAPTVCLLTIIAHITARYAPAPAYKHSHNAK